MWWRFVRSSRELLSMRRVETGFCSGEEAMTPAPKFAKETDLCAAFIAALKQPWVAYAETAGWDILAVNSEDGRQIGIEAKLKLNAKVMRQAVEGPPWWDREGPDYRAVLIPGEQDNDLTALAPFCGITIIRMWRPQPYVMQAPFSPGLPVDRGYVGYNEEWFERLPARRHEVPEFVPDVAAGSSAPLRLTKWKIAALKLAVLLDQTGYLTRDDFKRLQIDFRRWIGADGWLQVGENGFVAGKYYPNFRLHHPTVYAEIEAQPEKWQRADAGLLV
jgi:hypothetical protein